MSNSSFNLNHSALVPVYYWRGGRLQLLDLESDQTGWLICLCLQREGDVSLLPLAWQANAPDEHHNLTPDEQPYPTIHTQALEQTAVAHTLHQLQQDGWYINGQLTLTFTGADTLTNFTHHYQQYLWQTPTKRMKDEL